MPGLAKLGAWRVEVAKRALPKPPRPPVSSTRVCPGRNMSATTRPVSFSRTTVPAGTRMTRSSADLPELRPEEPGSPLPAWYLVLYRKSIKV